MFGVAGKNPEISEKTPSFCAAIHVYGDAIHCPWLKNSKSIKNLGMREREKNKGGGERGKEKGREKWEDEGRGERRERKDVRVGRTGAKSHPVDSGDSLTGFCLRIKQDQIVF